MQPDDPGRRCGAATARVFFALWPDPDVQAALHRYGGLLHRELGGRLTRADSVHLTLLFLGDVAQSQLPAVAALGDRLRLAPFSMTIDTARCWRHNEIAWVGPGDTPAALSALADQLQTAAASAGFPVERRPYAAHVTLVRKVRCRPLELAPPGIEWPVREFVLVRSQLHPDGSRYSVIGRWSAAGATSGG